MSDYVQYVINLTGTEIEGHTHLYWEYSPIIPVTPVPPQIANSSSTTCANRHSHSRSMFYAVGRHWIFFPMGNLLTGWSDMYYTSSIDDGVTWETPTLVRSDINQNYYLGNCIKYLDGKIYYISETTYARPGQFCFWMGTPNSDGTITWMTSDALLPMPNGYYGVGETPDIAVDSLGFPYATFQAWKDSDIYPHLYSHLFYVRANSVLGTSWSTPILLLTSSNVGDTGTAIHRLDNNQMLAIYRAVGEIDSHLIGGSNDGIKTMDITPYLFCDWYNDVRYTGLQSVGDRSQNVYNVWQWRDNNHGGRPAWLKLHIFNSIIGEWTTKGVSVTPALNDAAYPVICMNPNKNDLYIYYIVGNKVYRVIITNCPAGGVGTINPPQLVATAASMIIELQCPEYAIRETESVYSVPLAYFKPSNSILVGGQLSFFKDIIPYTSYQSVAVEIYRRGETEINFSKIAEVAVTDTTYKDIEQLDSGNYTYALRIRDSSGSHSMMVYSAIQHIRLDPQIEFAGAGGYNALRHAVFTLHSGSELNVIPAIHDGQDVEDIIQDSTMNIKLWDVSETDASVSPDHRLVDMKLHSNKEIELQNVEPFETDTYVTGSETSLWKRIYARISKSDKNVSARIRLKNGR